MDIRGYYFTDNTLMIKEAIGDNGVQIIYHWATQIWKELSIYQCLRLFWTVTVLVDSDIKERNKEIFKGLNISSDAHKLFCQEHQQQYFVIKLNFTELEYAANGNTSRMRTQLAI